MIFSRQVVFLELRNVNKIVTIVYTVYSIPTLTIRYEIVIPFEAGLTMLNQALVYDS